MSASCQIQDFVRKKLSGRKIDPVGFVDALLAVVDQVGEIQCNLGSDGALRFRIPNEPPPFEVELDAARGRLRMLCARLGVLCHEGGDPEVSLYGGEGIIRKEVCASASGAALAPGQLGVLTQPRSPEWRVRFKNTPSEQEFMIQRTAR